MPRAHFGKGLLAGCYDCFHLGHHWFLNFAAEHVDSLLVLTGTHEGILKLKGRPPIDPYEVRVQNIQTACPKVARVEAIDDASEQNLDHWTQVLEPDVLIVSEDQLVIPDKVQVALKYGIPLLILPRSPHPISTTAIRAGLDIE